MKKAKWLLAAALIGTLAGAVSCSSEKDEPLSEPPINTDAAVSEAEEPETEAPTDEEVSLSGINPLTGETGFNEAAENKRPVAVMVNNLKDALPQYGIEQADIIYEIPVEAGITRLMAVYADYTAVPEICSVRSCRYYYPIICLGMDAIYCHWGADQTIALDTLNRTRIDRLDGAQETDIFLRDEERVKKYASEHTGYLNGPALAEKIEAKGFRTDRNEFNPGLYFNFAQEGEKAVPDEMSAVSVTVNFSNAYYSTFEYDEASGTYKKLHSGNPHIDGKTGNQLAFENVIVLTTYIHTRECGYLMDVALEGGEGYYISNGGAQAITWTKNSEYSPIKLYNKSGEELEINVGGSYIGIIGTDKTVSIS